MKLLTREQIEAWRAWHNNGNTVDFYAGAFDMLCDMALQSLPSAVRDIEREVSEIIMGWHNEDEAAHCRMLQAVEDLIAKAPSSSIAASKTDDEELNKLIRGPDANVWIGRLYDAAKAWKERALKAEASLAQSAIQRIPCRGCEGRERDLCLDKNRCAKVEAF